MKNLLGNEIAPENKCSGLKNNPRRAKCQRGKGSRESSQIKTARRSGAGIGREGGMGRKDMGRIEEIS
jgi:hypothetical protein